MREHHAIAKKTSKVPGINQGDIVSIHEDKIPRQQWKVGLVDRLIQGRDGQVRAAVVKLSSGKIKELTRPVQCLYPIEINQEQLKKKECSINFVPDEQPKRIT